MNNNENTITCNTEKELKAAVRECGGLHTSYGTIFLDGAAPIHEILHGKHKKIDWAEVAKQNGLTAEELRTEVLNALAAMVDMEMDVLNIDTEMSALLRTSRGYDLKVTVERTKP